MMWNRPLGDRASRPPSCFKSQGAYESLPNHWQTRLPPLSKGDVTPLLWRGCGGKNLGQTGRTAPGPQSIDRQSGGIAAGAGPVLRPDAPAGISACSNLRTTGCSTPGLEIRRRAAWPAGAHRRGGSGRKEFRPDDRHEYCGGTGTRRPHPRGAAAGWPRVQPGKAPPSGREYVPAT